MLSNIITDSDAYLPLNESSELNSTISNRDDQPLESEDTMRINSDNNNGIASKDDLKITSGTLDITIGCGSVSSTRTHGGGKIMLNALYDALHSDANLTV